MSNVKRKAVDVKTVNSPNLAHLVNFIFEYTNKGYEPVLSQCHSTFGTNTVCMALYEELEVVEPKQDVLHGEAPETSETKVDSVGSTDTLSSSEVDAVLGDDTGNESVEAPEVEAPEKPARKPRAKVQK